MTGPRRSRAERSPHRAWAVAAALALGTTGCHPRCVTNSYPAHCDGNVAVQCQSGWMSLPVLTYTDCTKAAEGPGVCYMSAPAGGAPTPFCRTRCDPKTYAPHCRGNVVYNCFPDAEGINQVSSRTCNSTLNQTCKVVPDADGGLRADCQ